jgi:hypothetical protein
MAHSNRLKIHWTLVAAEIGLAIIAVVTAYLSEVENWRWYAAASALALILYASLKVFEAIPQARVLLVREDMADRMAQFADDVGATDFFNMHRDEVQAQRNESTRNAIDGAAIMWLCANSGASYLDPGIYRHWHSIEKRLQAGIEFRVVLLDPASSEKRFRNRLNVDGEHLDSKVNVANLIKIYNQYPTFDLRFAKNGMDGTVFATDQCLYFDPYHVGTEGGRIDNRTFCVRLQPRALTGHKGLYETFKAHFDTLWRTSVSFEEWLTSTSAVTQTLPALKPRRAEQIQ